MAKIIRHSYPKELSVGILLLVFVITFFLSGGIFEKVNEESNGFLNDLMGNFLVSFSVLVMVLILWEEMLFPVKVKPMPNGMVFRNHRTKLIFQVAIYTIIPVIIIFIYMHYRVNPFRFLAYAFVCLVAPVAGKIVSGLKNYNDFLRLSENEIEYKNNEKTGVYALKDIKSIVLKKDETKVLHKIQLNLKDSTQVMIDMDEMELDAYFESIDKFITLNYEKLLE